VKRVPESDLWDLVQKVLSLHHASPDELPIAIEEIIQLLKNIGVEVDEKKTFCWQPEHRERYEVFGHVEPGEHVVIERQPVVVCDKVLRKGLVRKIRERS